MIPLDYTYASSQSRFALPATRKAAPPFGSRTTTGAAYISRGAIMGAYKRATDIWVPSQADQTRSFLTRPEFSRVISIASKHDLERLEGSIRVFEDNE
jgi:hypothetical protein